MPFPFSLGNLGYHKGFCVVANDIISLFLIGGEYLISIVPHLPYPHYRGWIPQLLSFLCPCEYTAVNMRVLMFLWLNDFLSLEFMPSSGVSTSCGHSKVSFGRNLCSVFLLWLYWFTIQATLLQVFSIMPILISLYHLVFSFIKANLIVVKWFFA